MATTRLLRLCKDYNQDTFFQFGNQSSESPQTVGHYALDGKPTNTSAAKQQCPCPEPSMMPCAMFVRAGSCPSCEHCFDLSMVRYHSPKACFLGRQLRVSVRVKGLGSACCPASWSLGQSPGF